MTFDINEVDPLVLHPEDQESLKWVLPQGDQFSEISILGASAEQNAFDSIRDTFGMESLDEWWEKE